MDYKRNQDTYERMYVESAAPFAPDQSVNDPNPNASWDTGEAAFHATTWDTRLSPDGKSLSTHVAAGPANMSRNG